MFVDSLQESAVQAMLSLQLIGVPATHPIIALHVSTPSQNRLFEQAVSFSTCLHASICKSQKSSVHPTPSLQLSGVPFTQLSIALHVSMPSQATPLLQSESVGACEHESVASLQASIVHETPSSHGDPELGVQPVPIAPVTGLHISVPLQYSPSLHATLFGAFVQTPIVHTSTVQEKPSLQSTLLTHAPIPLELDDAAIPLELDDAAIPPIPLELDDAAIPPIPLDAAIPPAPPNPLELVVIAPPIPPEELTTPPVPPIPLELVLIPPKPPAPAIPLTPPLPPYPLSRTNHWNSLSFLPRRSNSSRFLKPKSPCFRYRHSR
jgi:hypothetical protein